MISTVQLYATLNRKTMDGSLKWQRYSNHTLFSPDDLTVNLVVFRADDSGLEFYAWREVRKVLDFDTEMFVKKPLYCLTVVRTGDVLPIVEEVGSNEAMALFNRVAELELEVDNMLANFIAS